MPTCPSGHTSDDADYCDVCGIRMAGEGGDAGATPASSSTPTPASAPSGEPCPDCGEPLFSTERFCESCGYDRENPSQPTPAAVETPEPAAAPTWQAVVGIDRAYYDRVMAELGSDPESLPFPAYTPERQYPLQAPHVRIGRRSQSAGFVPEIDLSKKPEDPAVSHEHAVLLPKPDDSWVLVDLGSTNGTTVNDTKDPVEPNVEVPLREGDRVYVGAWTVVTVKRA